MFLTDYENIWFGLINFTPMKKDGVKFYGHSVSRVTKDILRQSWFDWQAIGDYSKYRNDGLQSATFALKYNRKEKIRVSLYALPDLWETTELGLKIDILSGACKGHYKFAKTFSCDRIIKDICEPFDCPNIKAMNGLHDFLREFARNIEAEDNSFLIKRNAQEA